MLLVLLACNGPTDDWPETTLPCDSALAAGDTVAFATGLEPTEGIVFVDGRLFVSTADAVVELDGNGTVVATWPVEAALGLAAADTESLYVADPGPDFTLDGSGDDGHVLRVGLDGVVDDVAGGLPNPNAVLPFDGGVLVSDDTNASLWFVDDDGVSTWLDGLESPNGLGLSPDGDAVYVATTFVDDPGLWRIPAAGGVAGTPERVASFDAGTAPDGLAVDSTGDVWVALDVAGEVAHVDIGTGEVTIIAEDLTTPASLTFGQGDFDGCSLYVTSLYGDTVSVVGT